MIETWIGLIGILATILGVFLSLRLAHFKKEITTLQSKVEKLKVDKYNELVDLLHKRKKDERSPKDVLNITSAYFAFTRIEDVLINMIKTNRKLIYTDILVLVLLASYVGIHAIMEQQENIIMEQQETEQIFVYMIGVFENIITILSILSISSFFIYLYYINNIEDRLD